MGKARKLGQALASSRRAFYFYGVDRSEVPEVYKASYLPGFDSRQLHHLLLWG